MTQTKIYRLFQGRRDTKRQYLTRENAEVNLVFLRDCFGVKNLKIKEFVVEVKK